MTGALKRVERCSASRGGCVYDAVEQLCLWHERRVIKAVLDGYRAKGTEVDVTLKIPMCPELFVDELEIGLNILGVNGFVSYRDTGKLDSLVLCRLYELLEWYAAADPNGASLAAEALIQKLKELDTDDDLFPEYEVEVLSNYLKWQVAGCKPGLETIPKLV